MVAAVVYALLSAIASFFVQPVLWLAVLLVLMIRLKPPRWRRAAGWAALAVGLVFTNPWLYHAVMHWWEPAPLTMAEMTEPYDDALVLGGFTELWATPTDRLHLNADAGRFTQAVELYQLGKVRRLVFVSGGVTAAEPVMSEADLAARTAERFGVPREAIVALNTSRNTRENATECRAHYDAAGGPPARLLLVTSAFHARRSLGSFREAGLEVTLFPTDHRTGRNHADRHWSVANTVLPHPDQILSWGPLFREWLGLAIYRIRGWV
jgi:uncharacterized SAM-binding protein YcdF (DUF218 family)